MFLLKSITIIGLPILAVSSYAMPPADSLFNNRIADGRSIANTVFIDANKILMFVTNHGSFARDLAGVFGYDYGTFYPYVDTASISNGSMKNSPLYAGGIWLGGIDSATGETRVTVAEYSDEYVPGPISGGTFLPDNPAFKVYKLYRDSLGANPNDDYLNWPVDQGAPVDIYNKPLMLGNQMLWTVFNDANPNQHIADAGSTPPLGIEIQQAVWANKRINPDSDYVNFCLYLEYKLYNKGNRTLNNMYFSIWTDPDLGGAGDDLVGSDTLNNISFCYNSDNNDMQYDTLPPALGFKLIYGPMVPSAGDTAVFDGSIIPNYKNLGMTASCRFVNGTDPDDALQSYNYMRGFERYGGAFPNGTRHMFPGDPVLGTGDLDYSPSDRRMMASCGPFDFRPGDSQYVLIKMAVGQGGDRLSSITKLKEIINSSLDFCIDADGNGIANLLDVTFIINYLYKGGPAPISPATGDANGNGITNLQDITYIINYFYKGGPAPICR
jgi:hypothetical protein